jgi:hypothetical protein
MKQAPWQDSWSPLWGHPNPTYAYFPVWNKECFVLDFSLCLSLSVVPTLEHRAFVKLFQFPNPKTDGRTPWAVDQPVARPLPIQDNTNRIKSDGHPCLEWDSNPRSQCSNERRQFMPETVRPLWSAYWTAGVCYFIRAFCMFGWWGGLIRTR